MIATIDGIADVVISETSKLPVFELPETAVVFNKLVLELLFDAVEPEMPVVLENGEK